MPSLVLLGIRTAVSGDDLRVFSSLAILLRIIELVLIIPLLILMNKVHHSTKERECTRQRQQYADAAIAIFYSFLIISFISAVFQMINEVLIFRVSSVGTPVETYKRKRLQPLCAIKFGPLAVLRIAALVLGILSSNIVNDYCHCLQIEGTEQNICPNYTAYIVLLRGLLVTLCIEVSATALIYLYLALNWVRPRHWIGTGLRATLPTSKSDDGGGPSGWRIFCRLCCTCTSLLTCCLFGGREALMSDFIDISIALEELFDDAGHLDVTVSDIVHGLVLLAREQDEKRQEIKVKLVERNKPSSNRMRVSYVKMTRSDNDHQTYFAETKRLMLDFKNEEDRLAIVEGAHFMKMALAIYGHGMFLINHKATGLCSLAGGVLCGQGRLSKGTVQGDNLCGCNKAAFLQESGIDPENILYANFASGVTKRPYCVIVDEEYSAIVLIVRGTFSLDDAVTDILLKPVPLEEAGARYGFDGRSEHAHSGIYASAEWVAADLKRLGILESLMKGDSCRYPGYRLYVTGHSLGAGVAAIVSLMLHSSFPGLKCLCFEPPGCVLTSKVAQQDYIVSYVHGSDIVPRLSVSALENFRDDVLEMIARSQVPKYQVLAPNPLDRKAPGQLTHRRNGVPDSPFHQQLKEFWTYHRDMKSERGERSIQLYVPGKRIVHLVKTAKKARSSHILVCSSMSPSLTTTAIWAQSEDFLEIQLASSLLDDHDPGLLTQELEQVMDHILLNHEPEPETCNS